VAAPSTPAAPSTAPTLPSSGPDQRALVELLKSLLDRLAAPPAAPPANTGNIVHVPIEVAANVKQPPA
jgi:hypothetical protein